MKPTGILFCCITLFLGCKQEKSESGVNRLPGSEQKALDRMFVVADSLTMQAENIPASDSILRVVAPVVAKIGRSKSGYQLHRQQIMNLFYGKKIKDAQALSDSILLQYAQPEDTISGFYDGLHGWICWQSGNYHAGIAPLERAALLFEKNGLEKNLNVIYNTLGVTYGQLGDHEKAIQNYVAALHLNEKQADSVKISRNHKNLAFAYLNLGDLAKAAEHNRLGSIFQRKNNGSFELQLAEITHYQGKSAKAVQILRQLKKDRPELFDAKETDNAMHNLLSMGEVLLAAGQTEVAIPYLKSSLELQPSDASLVPWMRAKNCCLLGNACLKKKDSALALSYFQRALHDFVPDFQPSTLLENPIVDSIPPEVWAMEALCGKTAAFEQISIEKEQNKSKEETVRYIKAGLESASDAIQVIQKLKNNFIEDDSRLWLGEYTFHNFYEKPLVLALRLSQLTGDKSALEKAFLFASKSKASVLLTALAEKKQMLKSGVSQDSIRLLRDLRLSAAALQSQMESNPSDSIQNALFQAKRQLDKFRNSLHLTTNIPSAFDGFSVAQIQQWLPTNALMVEYFLGEQDLFVFSISKDKFEVVQKKLTPDFNTLTDVFLRSVSDWQWIGDSSLVAEQAYLSSASKLFDFLLKDALVAHAQTDRLFIVPDKKLARVPFSALLTTPYSGGWKDLDLPVLIKKMAVSYRFSSAISESGQTENQLHPSYGFGGFGTDYREGLTFSALKDSKDPMAQNLLQSLRGGPDTLDFADDEVDSIAQLTGGQKWINGQATKSNFLENAPNCRILHISLHTVETDPHDPTGLAILFSKTTELDASLLTSSELYSLDLNTDMAVVSSCQSGSGQYKQGEGTLSLGRAMALAGCKSTVVNLWKADDRASRDLMIAFYKNLKQGLPKDLALQQALLLYLNNTVSERAGPQFWANFAAVGEMDAIVFDADAPTQTNWWLGGMILLGVSSLILLFWGNRRKRQ